MKSNTMGVAPITGARSGQGRALCRIENDQAADPRGEWLERHHGSDDQLLNHVAAHTERAADRLSRRRARRALPVSRVVSEAQQALSGRVKARPC
jgi:hypothetical protein